MNDRHSRSVDLFCPTCAGTTFSFDCELPTEVRTYTCASCGSEFSYEEVFEGNQEVIENQKKEIAEDVIKDVTKGLKGLFK